MDPTHHYYAQQTAEFFHSTVDVDMAPIRQRFVARLPPAGHILDAGCGSGRDARAFAEAGFRVSAFDASAELARLASAHCGFEVAERRFEDVDEVAQFDGIWCCASLLHLPLAAMPETLVRLWTALRPGGTLYVSFKHGTGERTHGGRHFTDAEEAQLPEWFGQMPEAHPLDVWLTDGHHRPRGAAPAAAFAGAGRRGARVHHRARGQLLPQGLPLRPAGAAGAGGGHRVHRLQQHQPAGAAGRAGVELPGRLSGRRGFSGSAAALRGTVRPPEDGGAV